MTLLELDNEILLVDHLIEDHRALFEKTIREVDWDHSMKARKTASFGVPYDYSNMSYEPVEIPGFLAELIPLIASKIGFTPNNCLINYYYKETSSMGFHSDMTDFLDEQTGICIVSLGNPRILRLSGIKKTRKSPKILDSIREACFSCRRKFKSIGTMRSVNLRVRIPSESV